MAEGQWFYTRGGQQAGPVSLDQLRQMAASGQITPADLVWREGMANWQPMSSMPELGGAPAAPAPPAAPYGQPYGAPGAPYGAPTPFPGAPQQSYNGTAVTGLVLSILGVTICCGLGVILGPIGAILGFVAKSGMDRTGNQQGRGIATAAIVTGIIAFVLSAVLIPWRWHMIQTQLHHLR